MLIFRLFLTLPERYALYCIKKVESIDERKRVKTATAGHSECSQKKPECERAVRSACCNYLREADLGAMGYLQRAEERLGELCFHILANLDIPTLGL